MEAKKDLNNTQRKVLEEIYCQQVTTQLREYRAKRSKEREEFVQTVIEGIKKSKNGKAVQSAIDKLFTAVKDAEEFFKEQGVNMYTFRNVEDLEIKLESTYRNDDAKNLDIRAFDEETVFTADRYEKVRQEVRAKIWGMDSSYADIEKEIKAVLEAL